MKQNALARVYLELIGAISALREAPSVFPKSRVEKYATLTPSRLQKLG